MEDEIGLKTLMPSCSKESQLTTLQANQTRLVTKIRNVIERKNGIFKSFASLEHCRNSQLNHITEDFKNAAALINCFFIELDSDKQFGKEIAESMKANLNKINPLVSYLSNQKLLKKNIFSKIDAINLNDFPQILYNDIYKYITHGNNFFYKWHFQENLKCFTQFSGDRLPSFTLSLTH